MAGARKRLELARAMAGRRVLAVGDPVLDLDVYGVAMGLALETPTLKARRAGQTVRLGGASLVVRNLLALGARVTYCTAIGDDDTARHYLHWQQEGLEKQLVTIPGRKNTVKERYWIRRGEGAGHEATYKALQLDVIDDVPISPWVEERLVERIAAGIDACDAVVVADYRHGLLTHSLIEVLTGLAKSAAKPLYADSQVSEHGPNHEQYRDAFLVTLNRHEAERVSPGFTADEGGLRRLEQRLGTRAAVKLGADGCVALVGERLVAIRPPHVTVVDACGAGDAFLAAIALGDPERPVESLENAVLWASWSTMSQGADPPPCSHEQFLVAVARENDRPGSSDVR